MRSKVLASLVALLLALFACGEGSEGSGANAVVGIDYEVSTRPLGISFLPSCATGPYFGGSAALATNWTVGTQLVVTATPRFARPCAGDLGPCPDPQMVLTALNDRIWTVAPGPTPEIELEIYPGMRYLEAIATGIAGVGVRAQGRTFPPLEVRAVAPSGFRFYQSVAGELEPIVDRLVVARGASAYVLPQLVSATEPLCGFPAMTVKATGPTTTAGSAPRANMSLQVTGGDSGKIEFSAAGTSGTLMVDSD